MSWCKLALLADNSCRLGQGLFELTGQLLRLAYPLLGSQITSRNQ